MQEKGIGLPLYAYNSSIVYLEPKYDSDGKRTIMPKNISSSYELNNMLNDINLMVPTDGNKVNVYCEDELAANFVQFLLKKRLNLNIELYMQFVDIDLGWTNYIQLVSKKVPEFRKNIIILDGDVQNKPEYRTKKAIVDDDKNILFLPLVIEKDFFVLLKDHAAFNEFIESFCTVKQFNYDICFSNWPLESEQYNTAEYKKWFQQITDTLGVTESLYNFWIDKNIEKFNRFCDDFRELFNRLAEINEVDGIPNNMDERV